MATLIEPLSKLYRFRERSAVAAFLEENSVLSDVLLEAHRRIQEHFGPDTDIVLEVIPDPEVGGEQDFVAHIKTSLSSEEAHRRLDLFDREWWLKQPGEVLSLLIIDIEFTGQV